MDAGSFGNNFFAQVCPQKKEIYDAAYDKTKRRTAESPESMQAVIESFVQDGMAIKQPDTAALLATCPIGCCCMILGNRLTF